jgi:hypothetical protein
MKLTHVLLALVAVTLVALYVVATQTSREKFETDSTDATKSTAVTSGAAVAGVLDAADEERINGMVFKTYLAVFGVPPTIDHSKHYASIVSTEGLDEEALKKRIDGDALKTASNIAAPDTSATSMPKTAKPTDDSAAKNVENASELEMDADMRALRDKAADIAKMSGPLSKPDSGGSSDQMASKLRAIAGQVSALARQYDVPLSKDVDAPKGIESFISF